MLLNVAQDLSTRAVQACADHYKFDGEEAIRLLGLENVKISKKNVMKGEKGKKVSIVKSDFPLPYNGELNENCCNALRHNNGLYTQCLGLRKGDASFCKGCVNKMQKSGMESPEFGTIQERMAVGIFEYVDPKGKSPTPYAKIMKKYKLTKEQVLEEAGKLNITIDEKHFEIVDTEGSKRGRPKGEEKPKKEGKKGRPKKEKKVLHVEGGDDEDLFASMIAAANEDMNSSEKESENDFDQKLAELADLTEKAEKEAKKKAAEEAKKQKEAEKAEKEAKIAAEKAEKEAKKLAAEEAKKQKEAEKAEKEAKIAAEKAEKEAKIAAEKAEKEAKKKAAEEAKKQKEAEKAEKEAKKKAAEEAKKQKEAEKAEKKPAEKNKKPVIEEEEEEDVVKKITFEGKKYLQSKKTGIIYDYDEYVNNQEQVVLGKWNNAENKIDFNDKEEQEEEYDD
jgi:hypothetical protein